MNINRDCGKDQESKGLELRKSEEKFGLAYPRLGKTARHAAPQLTG